MQAAGLKLVRVFGDDIGTVGMGGFVRCSADAVLRASLMAEGGGQSAEHEATIPLPADTWVKFGLHAEVQVLEGDLAEVDALATVTLEAANPGTRIAEFFGLNLDGVVFYEDHPELRGPFLENTALYVPEIYFLDHDEALHLDVTYEEGVTASDGTPVVVKSCNRCERFLPIDLYQERNALSFSNHCVKRAPCSHDSFSRYEVQNADDVRDLLAMEPLASHVETSDAGVERVSVHYGFQLECRVCKKYFVNMPLNPMRNATQHREDSLRRRAIEDLLMQLLGHQWIFNGFRLQTGREFDDYVWERFERRCFKCEVELDSTSAMALDHTMPLAYLWPLSENATCLCPTCNSRKHDLFPCEFYSPEELQRLAELTGIPLERLISSEKQVNAAAVNALAERAVWFFDEFLSQPDYQKVRDDKLTADLVLAAIERVLRECGTGVDLLQRYQDIVGRPPESVTVA